MIKWVLIFLCLVAAFMLASKYTGLLEKNFEAYQENTTSLKDTGKIINNLKEMKEQREEDVNKSQKDF
jgi:hypothetical protein